MVIEGQVIADGAFQLNGAAVSATADLALGERGEPSLDLIEPRGKGRREVHMEARIAREPTLDGGSLVGTVVVHHQMHLEFFRRCLVDRAQKLQKLLRAVAPMQLTDDFASGDVKGCP